jgi:hypothetical protein
MSEIEELLRTVMATTASMQSMITLEDFEQAREDRDKARAALLAAFAEKDKRIAELEKTIPTILQSTNFADETSKFIIDHQADRIAEMQAAIEMQYVRYVEAQQRFELQLAAKEAERHEIMVRYLQADAERTEAVAKLAEVQKANEWISVKERLPELDLVQASNYVHVAYRCPGNKNYLQGDFQYWGQYGWAYDWKAGKPITFEDYGYIVDYWRETMRQPQPPQEAE